jgi:hypothetical protein
MLTLLATLALFLGLSSAAGSGSGANTGILANAKTPASSGQRQSDHSHNSVEITKFPALSVTKDWRDDWTFAFSGIVVLIGIGGVWYARNTLRVIQGQLQEIRTAGLQTDQMIRHAATQATATTAAAQAAEKAANLALTSAQSYQAAERAWMTYTEVIVGNFTNSTFDDSPEKTDGTMFHFKWINAGNTPAIKCTLLAMHQVITPEDRTVPTFTPPPNVGEINAPIVPRVPANAPAIPFRKSVIDALKRRECRIFLYSRADYEAIYPTAVSPHTEVCFEVEYAGVNNKTGEAIFRFRAAGPQNSAT